LTVGNTVSQTFFLLHNLCSIVIKSGIYLLVYHFSKKWNKNAFLIWILISDSFAFLALFKKRNNFCKFCWLFTKKWCADHITAFIFWLLWVEIQGVRLPFHLFQKAMTSSRIDLEQKFLLVSAIHGLPFHLR